MAAVLEVVVHRFHYGEDENDKKAGVLPALHTKSKAATSALRAPTQHAEMLEGTIGGRQCTSPSRHDRNAAAETRDDLSSEACMTG